MPRHHANARATFVAAALALLLAPCLASRAAAQSNVAALLAQPTALPEIALGNENAPIKIIEYGSLTCGGCAVFQQSVVPKLRAQYIDTGKVRFVFRDFPTSSAAVVMALGARCITKNDPGRFFAALDVIYKQPIPAISFNDDDAKGKAIDLIKSLAQQNGMTDADLKTCLGDESALNNLKADVDFATTKLKIDTASTLFINGELNYRPASFEELDAQLKKLLKKQPIQKR